MVQRFLTASGGRDKDFHLLTNRRLANILRQQRRANGPIMYFFVFTGLCRDQSVRFNHGIIRLLGINNVPKGLA
jgi:ribosomal protein S6